MNAASSPKRVAILATNGFEQSELMEPQQRLEAAGFSVDVVSPDGPQIRGWKDKDWGRSVSVDVALSDASPQDYDALVLPGGVINPDILRTNADAVAFIRAFDAAGKPLAAVCHGPWRRRGEGTRGHVVAVGAHRPAERGCAVEGRRGGRRWPHHYQPQAGRPAGLQRGDRRCPQRVEGQGRLTRDRSVDAGGYADAGIVFARRVEDPASPPSVRD